MVKIIVICTIVFVYYCEINAEMEHLQDNYPMDNREDISLYPDLSRSNSEARNNYFFKSGVLDHRRRRSNKVHTVEENTQTDKSDSESIEPITKKHHHHSRKNKEKKIQKKDEKDLKENDSSSSSSDRKLNTQKKRFKIKDRDDKKKSKHPKYTSMDHEREKDHIKNKKKEVKEKSKNKNEENSMDSDKSKAGIIKLSKTDTSHSSENDKINKSKQRKGKKKHKPQSSESKSEEGLRNVKSSPASSQAKVPQLPQGKILTTTTSLKPKPVHKMVTVKKMPPRKPILRAQKNRQQRTTKTAKRPTKLAALSLNKEKKASGRSKLSENGEDLPSTKLSPYSIMPQIHQLMNDFPEANVTITKAARTVEYNDIVVVSLKAIGNQTAYFRAHESKYVDDVPEKKIIFIVHGLTVMGLKHMTSLNEVNELKLLLSYYLKHLDKFDFILMPMANPDGYSASLASDRTIWNKNSSPQGECSGVFLDRNFDVAWTNTKDISSCSQLYPGAAPFSEEESKAVREVLHHYSHKIVAYIHVHAGTIDDTVFKGDAVLYPKGFTTSQSDDDKYIDLKGAIDEAMRNASFRVMSVTVDTIASWYGIVHGTSVDYAATVYGIPYAMEFVMQIYDSETGNNNALTEIWRRLIDTTFNTMWKSLQRNTDSRRSVVWSNPL